MNAAKNSEVLVEPTQKLQKSVKVESVGESKFQNLEKIFEMDKKNEKEVPQIPKFKTYPMVLNSGTVIPG